MYEYPANNMCGNITLTPPLSPPLQGRGIDVAPRAGTRLQGRGIDVNKIAKSLFAIKQVDY